MNPLRPLRLLSALCVLFSCAPAQSQTDLTFEVSSRTYPARLHVPEDHNRVGVLLIGGGSVTDMHWTIPGRIEVPRPEGQVEVYEPTIDGVTTRDADALATALVDAGFIVMQYSSVHEGDEFARHTPGMATGIPYPASIPIARRALELLRAREEVDRIILIGHSLGAARACHITHLTPEPPAEPPPGADPDEHRVSPEKRAPEEPAPRKPPAIAPAKPIIAPAKPIIAPAKPIIAIVSLAGAYMTPIRTGPSALSREALGAADTDADGVLTHEECIAAGIGGEDGANLERIDHDRDGLIRGWELAAWTILQDMTAGERTWDDQPPSSFADRPWPAEVLAAQSLPTLAIFGALDPITIHAPLLERWAEEQSLDITIGIHQARGHQLSPEKNGKFGPIDPAVIERVVEWCGEVVGGSR